MAATSLHEQSIFEIARKIDAAEAREAYLQQICGDDAAIAKRVRALLAMHDDNASFLESPAVARVSTLDSPAVTERIGSQIGPYKLKEQIGEGGMGLVYVAEQHEPIRRKVALKLIKPGMDTRQVISRFEAERQALALMNHANIAKVFDGGETPSGRPYFVMELVKGAPITEYCDQNRLTARARLELFSQVCAAVQHAHQKGIIHRDIKPSNVIVSSHDGTPVVKVIDFGVAKAIGQQLTDKSVYTNFSQFIGTPLYMSPEQAGQSDLDIDTRTDVYALGVLLYELLTGTTPFDKDRLSKASYDEIRRLIREEEPPKPSTRMSTLAQAGSTVSAQRQTNPQQLCLLLRGELDWIVMKALEKDRNRRYESASALAADVDRYLKDEPVQACPPSRQYLFGKFLRRHRTGVLTSVAALVMALVLASGIGWVMLDRAERRSETERKSAATTQAVNEDLKEADIWTRKERWAEARHALERATTRLMGNELRSLEAQVDERRRQLALVAQLEDAQLKASDLSADGKIEYGATDRAYAAVFAGVGLDVTVFPAEQIARQIKTYTIRTQLVRALDFWAFYRECLPKGDGAPLREIAQLADDDAWRKKLRDFHLATDREALERLADDKESLVQPPANLLILSYCLKKAKAPAAQVELLRRAQDQHPTDFWINWELGVHLSQDLATAGEAISFLRVALTLQSQSPVIYNSIGNAFNRQKKLPEAIAAYHKAIELQPRYGSAYKNLGLSLRQHRRFPEAAAAYFKAIERDPEDGETFNNLGVALSEQGELGEATKAFLKAIEVQPNSAAPHHNLGNVFLIQKNLTEAVAAYRKAIKLDPDRFAAYIGLGHALRKQGKSRDAEAEHREAIKVNPMSAEGYDGLGYDLIDQQRFSEAAEAFEKVVELKPDHAKTYNILGVALIRQDKLPQAVAAFRKAIALGPDNSEAWHNLAVALRKQQKLIDLIEIYVKAPDRGLDLVKTPHIYNAACAAALVGCGEGKEAAMLDAKERARFREQALIWLRARLTAERTKFEKDPEKKASAVWQLMQRWQQDKDFHGVRGKAALGKLPEAERQEWLKLWEAVAALEQRAAAAQPR